MDDVAQAVAAYALEASRKPFSYATGHDCAQGLVAGWVRLRTGLDVAAPWRGRYSTSLGCYRLVRKSGGLVKLMSEALAPAGYSITNSPSVGDVGAVLMYTEHGVEPVGAILGVDGWITLMPRGVRSTAKAEVAAAWSLNRV